MRVACGQGCTCTNTFLASPNRRGRWKARHLTLLENAAGVANKMTWLAGWPQTGICKNKRGRRIPQAARTIFHHGSWCSKRRFVYAAFLSRVKNARVLLIFLFASLVAHGYAGVMLLLPQVATRTWEELNAEAQKSVPTDVPAADGGDPASGDGGDGMEWLQLWGVERSSLPEWFTTWKSKDNAIRNKIRKVVKQELDYMEDREAMAGERRGEDLPPKESGLPPPGPPLLDESGRFFDLGAYVGESTVFPFVLIESFWKYSDPKSAAAGVGGEEEGAAA